MSVIIHVARYLAAKALANEIVDLQAIYDYFINGLSPSDLAKKYGVEKNRVRGYVQRILEKCGSFYLAKALVKYLVPEAMKLAPVIVKNREFRCVCTICGEVVPCGSAIIHLFDHHRDVLEDYAFTLIERVEKVVRGGKR